MKRYICGATIAAIFIALPFHTMAVDYLAQADKIYDQGGIENFKKSIDLYLKAAVTRPLLGGFTLAAARPGKIAGVLP